MLPKKEAEALRKIITNGKEPKPATIKLYGGPFDGTTHQIEPGWPIPDQLSPDGESWYITMGEGSAATYKE